MVPEPMVDMLMVVMLVGLSTWRHKDDDNQTVMYGSRSLVQKHKIILSPVLSVGQSRNI